MGVSSRAVERYAYSLGSVGGLEVELAGFVVRVLNAVRLRVSRHCAARIGDACWATVLPLQRDFSLCTLASLLLLQPGKILPSL